MVKYLTKELRRQDNEWNTSGPVNVALILRALRPSADLREQQAFEKLCKKTAVGLELLVEECQDKDEWGDEDNRKMHLKAFRKMLREVRSFYEEGE